MEENLENHCRDACFKPYKDLFNLQTRVSSLEIKPGGGIMKTYSSRSPCKKALLTSS